MNKSLRKVLVTGASLLMFAGIGIGASNVITTNQTTVSAKRIGSATWVPSSYRGNWYGHANGESVRLILHSRRGYLYHSRYTGPVVPGYWLPHHEAYGLFIPGTHKNVGNIDIARHNDMAYEDGTRKGIQAGWQLHKGHHYHHRKSMKRHARHHAHHYGRRSHHHY